jgi:serine/threonine protein kinase
MPKTSDKKGRGNKKSPLAQGTFGCVYHPGFTCNHKPLSTKYITKIHASDELVVQNEIAISNKIQTIPNYELYFSPVLENCEVNLAKVERERVEKCKFIKEDIANKKSLTYVSTKIRFIEGESLLDYVEKNPKYSTISFLYKTLCESVKMLAEKDIVHFDLRENNMVVSKQGVPIIIDFGISIDFAKLNNRTMKDAFYAFTTEYKPWCVQIVLIAHLLHNKGKRKSKFTGGEPDEGEGGNVQSGIQSGVQSGGGDSEILSIFDKTTKYLANKPYLKDAYMKYREKFKNPISLKDLLSTYKHWDTYAVSILLIQMLEKTNQEPDETHVKLLRENLFF